MGRNCLKYSNRASDLTLFEVLSLQLQFLRVSESSALFALLPRFRAQSGCRRFAFPLAGVVKNCSLAARYCASRRFRRRFQTRRKLPVCSCGLSSSRGPRHPPSERNCSRKSSLSLSDSRTRGNAREPGRSLPFPSTLQPPNSPLPQTRVFSIFLCLSPKITFPPSPSTNPSPPAQPRNPSETFSFSQLYSRYPPLLNPFYFLRSITDVLSVKSACRLLSRLFS